ALDKNSGDKEARQILTSMGAQTGDAEAERLYLLSETEHTSNDEEAVQRTLNELRQFGPTSPWLEKALLSAGNMYLLKRDYDHAMAQAFYQKLSDRFHNYYYAELARQRLKTLPRVEAGVQAVQPAILAAKGDAIKPETSRPDASKEDPPKTDVAKDDLTKEDL